MKLSHINLLLVLVFTYFTTNTYASTPDIPSYAEVETSFPDWQKRFIIDIKTFRRTYLKNKTISKREIEAIFSQTLEPDSNMIKLFSYWVNRKYICVRGPSPIGCLGSPEYILAVVIQNSKTESSGGIHKGHNGLIVYLDTGKEKSNPYANKSAPKTSTLVRGYPFLIFKKIKGNIVLVSLSKEFGKVMDSVRHKVFT